MDDFRDEEDEEMNFEDSCSICEDFFDMNDEEPNPVPEDDENLFERLSEEANQKAMGVRTLIELFIFSLISLENKALVQSQRIQTSKAVMFMDGYGFLMIRLAMLHDPEDSMELELEHGNHRADDGYADVEQLVGLSLNSHYLERPKHRLQDWIEHLRTTFNMNSIHIFFNSEFLEIYDLEDLRMIFEDIPKKTACMHFNLSNDQIHDVLVTFEIANLHLQQVPKRTYLWFSTVMDAKYKTLDLGHAEEFCISDLPRIKANKLIVSTPNIDIQDINRYLSEWTRRMMNPRLKKLCLRILGHQVELNNFYDEVFVGIPTVELESTRIFPLQPNEDLEREKVTEGYDITRRNGTKATIQIDYHPNVLRIQMFVWS